MEQQFPLNNICLLLDGNVSIGITFCIFFIKLLKYASKEDYGENSF